jgi:hypothetical protein
VRAPSLGSGSAPVRQSRGRLHPRRFGGLPDSPWLVLTVLVFALVVAYLLMTAGSFEFRLYLLWALAVTVVALWLVIKYAASHRRVWLVVAAGLMVKMFGSLVRYEVIHRAYDGNADAGVYYGKGLAIAERVWSLDWSDLFTAEGPTVGARFVANVSGLIVSISGPSQRAAFLLFSLLAFAGVLFFASSYRRVEGSDPVTYLAWLVLWPSLFFWPSSVGKEALLLFALGLAVWGFARFPRPLAWPALAGGLLLVGMVRPHVAGVAMVAMAVAAMMAKGRGGVLGAWYFQTLFWAGALGLTFYLSAGALGIEDSESAVELVEKTAAQSNVGGSATGSTAVSVLGIPSAFMRALFRPFIWEAGSTFVLLSAIEVLVLIVLIIWRRKQLWASLRDWRTDRLLGFSLIFVVLYALMLGFAMSNLAIIARQRVLLLPMLLLLLQARRPEPEPEAEAEERS